MSDPYGSYDPHAAPGWPAGPGHQPTITVDRRPGTVTAAGVITIVLSALALVGGLVFAIVVAADRPEVRKQVLDQASSPDRYSATRIDHILNGLLAASIVTIVLAVVAIVVAIGVLRRSRAARIVLTVLAAVTILPAILASLGVVGLPWLAGTIIVIVLLYIGGANAWFSRRAPQQAAYPPYPGYPPAY